MLDAARDVFAKRGYAAASIEEVVARARVSRSTFYAFFPTKEDCLLAVFWQGSDRLLQALREVAESDLPLELKVRTAIERFLETLASDPAMAQIVLIEAVGAGERVEEARTQVRRMFAAGIETQLREVPFWRERPAHESEIAGMATMAAITEPLVHLVATGRLDEWRTLTGPLTRYFLRALGPDLISEEPR